MPSLDLRSTSRPLWHATRFTLSWLVGVSVALTLVLAVVGTLGVGARPSDGSSNMLRRGCPIRQRPIASICGSPPDRVPAACRRRSASRGNRANTRSRVCFSAARARLGVAPISRFSSTERLGNTCRPSATWPTPASQTRWLGHPVMSVPSNRIEPRTGRSMPWIARISELLPAPLAPTIATISPAAISRETSASAWASP